MSNPQTLSDTVVEFPIDRAKYFNFQIDDVDRAQASPKLMEAAMNVAARALANNADQAVYEQYVSACKNFQLTTPSYQALIDELLTARQVLFEKGVNDSSDIVIEVSPAVASIILKGKKELLTDNTDVFENGCIGSIYGCKVYVTNNIALEYENEYVIHKCLMRTKRAIAFAEQLSEIDAYRPEKRFADAVKGLHLYGVKTVYPNELVCVSVELINEDA
jgi:hypothetical protein